LYSFNEYIWFKYSVFKYFEMNLTTFLTALFVLYGGYYLIIVLSELLSKKAVPIDNSKLDFVFPVPADQPQKIGSPNTTEEKKEKEPATGTNEEDDWKVEKVREDLQGDLGMETITEDTGIEVSEENLQAVLEQNK
jgi:hypothetical protein